MRPVIPVTWSDGERAFCRCPVCSTVFEVKPAGEPNGYRDRWPNHRIGDLVPELCSFCWGDLEPGQRVKVRWLSQEMQGRSSLVSPGDVGVVSAAVASDAGEREYCVRCVNADGSLKGEEMLARQELYRLLSDSDRTPPVAK
jgi:hypothetical protein